MINHKVKNKAHNEKKSRKSLIFIQIFCDPSSRALWYIYCWKLCILTWTMPPFQWYKPPQPMTTVMLNLLFMNQPGKAHIGG